MLLNYALPKKTNEELIALVAVDDEETIIRCHIKLAYALAKKFGKDDEYFDAAIYGLTLGVKRLKELKHDNVTGYLVHWINRHLREVKKQSILIDFEPETRGFLNFIDLEDSLEQLPNLDRAIISMLRMKFTNEEICNHLGTTQWFIMKAKNRLKSLLKKHMEK
ncbi:MAG: hypothetical protein ACFFG0_15535 [Candidatus Thorarchaeota archaeon]